jgi:two-component system, OmpR family, phosphate regulon sensor histidine kinase PhoR
MKVFSLRQVALLIAASGLAIFIVFVLAIAGFNIPMRSIWIPAIFGGILLFISTFFASVFFIEKFIYRRIKIIYKTIHSLKIKNVLPEHVTFKNDLLGQVNRDVLEWAQTNRKEIEQLKNQEEYRKEFIGNVSHELKTPIFNIQGYILTLLEGGLEDEKINREYLFRASRSVERMINIVEDLDTVTRLESGQLLIEPTKFDLVELCKEVIEQQEINAKRKNISLKLKAKVDKPIFVLGDKDRIRQVLTNLLINSVKYGKEGGLTEFRFYDMDDNILVEVADNGIGIAQEHLPRLFERFYRVDKSRSRESGGSGLGLAIVKHIIEAHNQTINVRSTVGAGSTFSFTLQKAR